MSAFASAFAWKKASLAYGVTTLAVVALALVSVLLSQQDAVASVLPPHVTRSVASVANGDRAPFAAYDLAASPPQGTEVGTRDPSLATTHLYYEMGIWHADHERWDEPPLSSYSRFGDWSISAARASGTTLGRGLIAARRHGGDSADVGWSEGVSVCRSTELLGGYRAKGGEA